MSMGSDNEVKLFADEQEFADFYRAHRQSSVRFMLGMIDSVDDVLDIYQDAVIVFFQKIKTPGFELTCSPQTYLNSICRNQILKRFAKIKMIVHTDEFRSDICDWFEAYDAQKEARITSIEKALTAMKKSSEQCYNILHSFFYLKWSMEKIADNFNFSSVDSAKSQKAKCQKKLKELALMEYRD